MPGLAASLIAHQGGWDEILFVLAPIALFAGLLALANKRAAAALAEQDAEVTSEAGGADRSSDRNGTAHGSGETGGGPGEAGGGPGVGAGPEQRPGPGRPTG